jgi:hypothetical protein
MILAIIFIVGVPLLIAAIVAKHKQRIAKESRALDSALFRKAEDIHE